MAVLRSVNYQQSYYVKMEAGKTYLGNCHCGRFRFDFNVPESYEIIVCDCRLCTKKGYLWLPIDKEALRVVRDDGHLKAFKATSLHDKVRF